MKHKIFRILRIAGIVSVIGLFVLLCGAVYVFCSAPKLSQMKLQDLDQSLMLYDKDSSLIASMDGGEDRVLCDIETLSTDTLHAFIAAEDVRFYSHHGIDPRRIAGAVIANIKSGGYREGASTITQQLVKLTHLTSEKTIKRKLYEVVLALQLERQYEKDEILEMYLNTVYFGGGYYGIEAAAKGYFGINASQLAPWQAATLAAVLKAPSSYAPHIDPQACRIRRDLILNIMAQEGFLSTEEAILQKA
ncbi:MAG: transglycosylase domain-containing protein, partial [Clostridia bacterium]|nr:transglycosylase domain-containing protein [Clostridia bacterium]